VKDGLEENIRRSYYQEHTTKDPEEIFGGGDDPCRIRRIEGRQYDPRALSKRRDQLESVLQIEQRVPGCG
jgi:hypothetical protein